MPIAKKRQFLTSFKAVFERFLQSGGKVVSKRFMQVWQEPHKHVARPTIEQIPKVSSTNPRLSDSDRHGWHLMPLVFLAAQQA